MRACFGSCRPLVAAALLVGLALGGSAARAQDKAAADKAAAAAGAAKKNPVTEAADAFEAALKKENMLYQRIESPGTPTAFTVGMQDGSGGSSIGHFSVYDGGFTAPDGRQIVYFSGWAQAIGQKNLPASVGMAVAEFNDKRLFSLACLNDTGAYGCMAFYFDPGGDPFTIYLNVMALHWTTVALKDALAPILKSLPAEK